MSLMNRLLNNSRSIREITNEFDTDTHLPFGSGVTYHLLARKIVVIDMQNPIDLEQTIDIKCIDEGNLEEVKYG